MAASYPGAIKSFTTKTNKVDLVDAAHINDLQLEVTAIQNELGTDVAGTATDLKTRLAVCIADDGSIIAGTSFTASPVTGQLFYRSDEGKHYGRSSSNWVDLSVGSLGNCLFCFQGQDNANAVFNVGTGLNPAISGSTYAFWAMDGVTLRTIIPVFKWVKIADVSTVTIYGRIWVQSGGGEEFATLRVDIGGQNGSVNGTANQTTPEQVSFTIDVSSLTNGQEYDVTIQMQESTSGVGAYCSSLVAYGS